MSPKRLPAMMAIVAVCVAAMLAVCPAATAQCANGVCHLQPADYTSPAYTLPTVSHVSHANVVRISDPVPIGQTSCVSRCGVPVAVSPIRSTICNGPACYRPPIVPGYRYQRSFGITFHSHRQLSPVRRW